MKTLHETNLAWVSKTRQGFTVWVNGLTYATSESTYTTLDLAKARADYISQHWTKETVRTFERNTR